MMLLKDLDNILSKEFQSCLFKEQAINGIQIGQGEQEVNTVCLAVDATLGVLHKAISLKADLLIVHHGIFWGNMNPITGSYFTLVQNFIVNQCALYALHLPLDSHKQYGNNAQLALLISEHKSEPYFEHQGNSIGVKVLVDDCEKMLQTLQSQFPYFRAFHTEKLTKSRAYRVGIVSGQLSFDFLEQAMKDLDILITGEITLPLYNKALENHFPLITLGHYSSERLGVISIKEILKKYDNSIKCFFIEEIKPI